MTNFVYSLAKQELLHGNTTLNLLNGNVYVALANSTYLANQAGDQFFSNTVGGLVTTPVQLTGVSITAGVLNGANVTFPTVSGGNGMVTHVLLYISPGANAYSSNTTAPLVAHIDTGTGLPIVPNGGDITIAWDSGANKIFAL